MKKVIAALVVLAIASPALAASITAVQISGTEIAIQYDNTGTAIRAVGLDIQVIANDVNIVGVIETDAAYDIYPGSIVMDAQGNISSPGTPVGSAADHADTQAGLNTPDATIEMASLVTTPGASGTLCVIVLSGQTSSLIDLTANGARGGVVDTAGASVVTLNDTTMVDVSWNRTKFANWVGWTKPASWLNSCFFCGDIMQDTFVMWDDVTTTYNYFSAGAGTGNGDFTADGFEMWDDVTGVYNKFAAGQLCPVAPGVCP